MPNDKKARVGFSLDFKDSKAQINSLVQALEKAKKGLKDTGKTGESSLNRINLGAKAVFQNITALSSTMRRSIASGRAVSKKEFRETLNQAKALETRILKIHDKTTRKFTQSQGAKRKALKATMRTQEQALNQLNRISKITEQSLEKQKTAYNVLASIITIKVSSVMRNLIEQSALLAAKNEVLGTAMKTVGNNAGFTNAELDRSEQTIRKLGISINDTRELITRFAQAQLGLESATKLARAAQDLAAGSTLGSSEALRIMTQSILSLLPRQLRQFGVVVNLNQVYKEQSRILGKSVNDLTSLEKRQGLLNKIFEEAAKRAGAYERSMEDTGKVLTTLTSRVIPDTLSMLGDNFLPVLAALTFGFQDLLKWIQQLPGWVKTMGAAFFAAIAAVTTFKALLITLSATLGFVKAGFVGAATAAATTGAALGPLIIAVGALAAALVIIPSLFNDSATSQEKMLESSKSLLNVEVDRLKSLKDLRSALEDQTLAEEDIQGIIENNIKRHKELIPLIGKEKVTREDIITILDTEIDKRKEVVETALEGAKELNKVQLETLKDEQQSVGQLIIALAKLNEKYGEGKVPVLTLVAALKVFEDKVQESGGSIDNLGDSMRAFAKEDIGSLQRSYQKLGDSIRNSTKEGESDFGLAAKGIVKNITDMEQAFLGLNQQLDKLSAKTTKKFPFQALIKEQDDFQRSLDKAALTEERRSELGLKAQAAFQAKFEQAELKFREKLDSIGATALQKIEVRRQRALEVNKGGVVAIQAIEKQAAADRNAVHARMWEDRLKVTQASVDAIIQVIRTERDLAIAVLSHEASILLAGERVTADKRIEIRQEFNESALALLRASQDEELSARQQYFEAVGLNIQELFNKGIINEEQFNAKSKVLATELKSFRQQQLSDRVTFLKSTLNEMYSEEVGINEKLKQLELERAGAARSTADTIRKLQQQGLTAQEVFIDERKRAEELLAEGELALRENNFDRVKEINNEIKSIAQATSKEVRESGKKDAEVLISADNARIGSIKLVSQAGELLQRSFEEQRVAEEIALVKVKDKIDDVKRSLDFLLEEKKEIDIEVVGNAETQISSIQDKLDALEDKTITVTVRTNSVSVGGGGSGVTEGGAGAAAGGPVVEGEGFAKGSVDIQGAGTSKSDSILAFLSRGESVVSAAATQMFKPILELMNSNPEGLRNAFASQGLGPAASVVKGGGGTTNSTSIGDVKITVNGVDSNDVRGINWKKVVREQIAPEIKKLVSRRAAI